jgi:hypothetical protein
MALGLCQASFISFAAGANGVISATISRFSALSGDISFVSTRASLAARPAVAKAIVSVATVVTVTLLQHCRGTFFEFVDPDRQDAEDILIQPLLTFHFSDSRRRRINVHQSEMGFAVFADPIGERLQAPRLDLGNRSATFFDDRLKLLDKRLDLLAGYILPRQKNVFV